MSENSISYALDPWVASSLLQKAIRRGEAELAKSAVQALYRHRGIAVFRRLSTIAVEDIGIADITLVHDVTRLAADKALRALLGSDAELMDDLSCRMALAVKDRSADYLYSMATKLETAASERPQLAILPFEKLVGIACDEHLPLTRRAVAALIGCTVDRKAGPALITSHVSQLINALAAKSQRLNDAVLDLARVGSHPFCLLLPIIWSRWWHFGAESTVVQDALPPAETVRGIPLYAFDKHTFAGKQAIARLARENELVANMLRRWAPEHRHADVTGIAAFYADAAPVARRLNWSTGSLLVDVGCHADMLHAGCAYEGVRPILPCVRQNLTHLNELRRASFRRR